MRYLLNAISLNSVATFGSRLVGPAAALALHHFIDTGSVFVMTSIFYVLAMLLMWGMHSPGLLQRSVDGLWRQTVDTWKYIGVTPMLPVIFLLVTVHCGLTMSIDAILPQVAAASIHGSSSTYDLLVMSFGAGTMAGTFALGGLRSEQAKGTLLWLTGLLSGLTTAGLAVTHGVLPAFLVMSIMGASQGMFMALGNTLVQEVVPDHLRGRISGAYLMAGGGAMSIGNLIAGPLADRFGVEAVLLAPALLFLAILTALSGLGPGLRRLYRTGTLPEAAPAPRSAVAS
jgi:predicted MFS family arabinose efflux permease